MLLSPESVKKLDTSMKGNTANWTARSPWAFFALVFVLSVPFWVIEAVTDRGLPEVVPETLPVSVLMAVTPVVAASILSYGNDGIAGVWRLLQRSVDYDRVEARVWYVPTLVLMPTLLLSSYLATSATGASPPESHVQALTVPVLFALFFLPALCEELGWQGYACDPLRERWGAVGAALIVGSVWAVWHVVPNAQAGRPPMWILWQCAATVAMRVLIVWLYNNTGRSVFAATVCHTTINVSVFSYPDYGSSYDPFVAFVGTAIAAVAVALLWGPRTLARFRYA